MAGFLAFTVQFLTKLAHQFPLGPCQALIIEQHRE